MLDQSAAVAVEIPEIVYEQRSEARYEDIIDNAVITFRGREYPVPVVNISSRGTQIECDIQPRLGESLIIQFENCSRMHGFVRWSRDGKLGIRFGHEIILAS
ncbi:MAG TPA: PilZ domain-containing protein [Allosphingosinicella sp.]|nr:PilZ domain-containing protein [Allosphingosinicella sp.]